MKYNQFLTGTTLETVEVNEGLSKKFNSRRSNYWLIIITNLYLSA